MLNNKYRNLNIEGFHAGNAKIPLAKEIRMKNIQNMKNSPNL